MVREIIDGRFGGGSGLGSDVENSFRAQYVNAILPAGSVERLTGAPAIHAPEIAQAQETTLHRMNDRTVRSFANGFTLTQFTSGEMSGAEVLTDRHDRVIRQLEATQTRAPGRSRLEFEYSYADGTPPGQASSVVTRDAATRQTIATFPQPFDPLQFNPLKPPVVPETSIIPRLDGCMIQQVTWDQAGPMRHTEDFNLTGLQMVTSVEGTMRSQFVASRDIATPEGYVYPRGSLVTHGPGKVNETVTTVVHPNGDTDTYSRIGNNNPAQLTGRSFTRPQTVRFDVNGQSTPFTDIVAQTATPTAIVLRRSDGNEYTLNIRNGNIVDFDKDKPKESAVAQLPGPILFGGQDLRSPPQEGIPNGTQMFFPLISNFNA